jgi:hypothetical protein
VVAWENDSYGVDRRQFATNRDKGRDLDPARVEKLDSPFVAMSLQLRDAFGYVGRSRSRSSRAGPTRETS